ELVEADLGDFMREQRGHTLFLLEERPGEPASDLRGADEDKTVDTPRKPGVPVEFTWTINDTPMPAALDRQMLHQVITNILRNAIQAILADRGHGHVEVRVEQDGDSFIIAIDDDGPGVPNELRESIFDPYVTTKSDGTGLGLAIVKKIIVEHGGTVEV